MDLLWAIPSSLWRVTKPTNNIFFREKLADERNQTRREEKQKLFETILKMLNDLYLLFLSIKNSNDEALKVYFLSLPELWIHGPLSPCNKRLLIFFFRGD